MGVKHPNNNTQNTFSLSESQETRRCVAKQRYLAAPVCCTVEWRKACDLVCAQQRG